MLGRIGNSGTTPAAAGNTWSTVHLHWELHVNGQYLGAGLSTSDTRAATQPYSPTPTSPQRPTTRPRHSPYSDQTRGASPRRSRRGRTRHRRSDPHASRVAQPRRWRTRLELSDAIFEYLEIFHNRQRRHSSLGMLTPVDSVLRHARHNRPRSTMLTARNTDCAKPIDPACYPAHRKCLLTWPECLTNSTAFSHVRRPFRWTRQPQHAHRVGGSGLRRREDAASSSSSACWRADADWGDPDSILESSTSRSSPMRVRRFTAADPATSVFSSAT